MSTERNLTTMQCISCRGTITYTKKKPKQKLCNICLNKQMDDEFDLNLWAQMTGTKKENN